MELTTLVYLVIILALAVGIIGGFVSSLFGVGSGTIIVPAIIFLMGYDFHVATAISLLTISFISIMGVYQHNKFKNIRWKLGLTLGLFGLIGSIIGSLIAALTPTNILEAIFGVVLILVAYNVWKTSNPKNRVENKLITPVAGVTAGLIGGLLGLGGGVIFVPFMYLIGIPMHQAVGTSLLAIFFTVVFGSATDIALKLVTLEAGLKVGAPMIIGAVVGSRYGTLAANKLDAKKLRKYFAFWQVAIAVLMFLKSAGLM